jgi:peptidoglycan/xylan/chitin deacetylase (PgdA/CDA1 family)
MLISLARPFVQSVRRAKNLILSKIDTPVIVLLYHRVAALASDPQLLAVSPENFRDQMSYLRDRYPLVNFEDNWSHLKSPSVAVTFDDGYADNALNALPILEDVGVPATFFVSTDNIDTQQEYWWDELENIILGDRPLPKVFNLNDERYGRRWPTDTLLARKKFYLKITPLMKKVAAERRDDWLNQFRRWAGTDETGRKAYRTMTSKELQHLANSKFATIGAHTVTHSRLSVLSEKQQREEILSSKRQLEALLGRTITTFSYPYGRKNDYNSTSVRLCREAGFTKAASNFPGHAYRWTDALQVPRYLVRNWDEDTFDDKMKQFGVR